MGSHKLVLFVLFAIAMSHANGEPISAEIQEKINLVNSNYGPVLGVVAPNLFELNPLLQSPKFTPYSTVIDISGRRFRFGRVGGQDVVIVMTGLSVINAAAATQLMLSFFNVVGVVHYGIAGNANPSLNIGDVAIPRYWGNIGLWVWQRYGQGADNELPLEANGDYNREFGYLSFGKYCLNETKSRSYGKDNTLNNIWFQQEEIFPIDGTPEERQHIFWVPVDPLYLQVSKNLENLKLERCVDSTTCLKEEPKVKTVERGGSSSIYVDNAAYRTYLQKHFHISPVDMESASVGLIAYQHKLPFIAIRALSDLAGGGSADSNEADTFITLASVNSIIVLTEFIEQLSAISALRSSY